MKKCKTCRQWSQEYEIARRGETPPPLIYGGEAVGECLLAQNLDGTRNFQRMPDIKMHAQDGSDYVARLHTKESFSCSEWQPAEG